MSRAKLVGGCPKSGSIAWKQSITTPNTIHSPLGKQMQIFWFSSSPYRISWKSSHMFLLKISRSHHFHQQYYYERVDFAILYKNQVVSHPGFLRRIMYSGECNVLDSQFANTHNKGIWGPETTNEIQQHNLHIEKVVVLCALHAHRELWPIYSSNELVRKDEYYQMLNTYVRSEPQ